MIRIREHRCKVMSGADPEERRARAMTEIRPVVPVKLFCGMIAVNEEIILRAKEEMRKLFGGIDLESDLIPFDFTDYYREEMGEGLLRKFVSFSDLIDPGRLADIKIQTNKLERTLAIESKGRSRRRVNLDPGYVSADKLVLATTKNFSHRIYLRDGIYAEVTLNFKKSGCVYFDWTYPGFRSGKYTPFFLEVRRRAFMVRQK